MYIIASNYSAVGRNSADGIETSYRLNGPGIEYQWEGEIFQTGRGAHPASYTIGTGAFPGVNRSGRGVDHPPQSIAKVQERVKL